MSDVLLHLGVSTDELQESLLFAQHHAANGIDVDEVERRAWYFWSRRGAEGAAFTAIAQLLYSLSRLDRSNGSGLAGPASTPLCILEGLATRNDEVLNRVLDHFSAYVRQGAA